MRPVPVLAMGMCLTLLFFSAVAQAQETAIEQETPGPERAFIAVVDFDTLEVPGEEAAALTDRLRSELRETEIFVVIDREDVAQILEEQATQLTDCADPDCLAEIGTLVGADQVVGGRVERSEGRYTIVAMTVNSETGEVLDQVEEVSDAGMNELLNTTMKRVARRLAGFPVEVPVEVPEEEPQILPSTPTKSPHLAFLMSVAVPGAGELYSGATKRGIGFLAVEGLVWGLYFNWNGKGKDQEKEFRAFADSHWKREDYERWRTSIFTYGDTTHTLPDQISKDEKEVQQYYELIGKYDQFVYGWNDREDREGNFASDISDSTRTIKSEKRVSYEDMRDESNKLLKKASYTLGVVLFNHVISAIDAARHAKLSGEATAQKERIRVRMALREEEGRPVPMVVMSRRFY